MICEECGDESIDHETAKNVERQVQKALSDGIKMGFIDFNHAARIRLSKTSNYGKDPVVRRKNAIQAFC